MSDLYEMKHLTVANKHDDCRGRGITSVVDFQTLSLTWGSMMLNPPHVVMLTFEDDASATRWHEMLTSWGFTGDKVSFSSHEPWRRGPSVLIDKDFDHAELMCRIRGGQGIIGASMPPDLSCTLAQEMTLRCRSAHGVMHLKSLVPSLPLCQDQDLSMWNVELDGPLLMMGITHDGVACRVSLNDPRDVTSFAARVPAVRWDKLDFILETFHVPPVLLGDWA